MSARPSIAVALLIGLLASALANRAQGAIIALSPVSDAMSGTTSAGKGSHDPAEDRDSRDALVAIDSALPADGSGMSGPSASSLTGGAHAAALAESMSLILESPLSSRLSGAGKLQLPEPHPSGLLRPPTCESQK